MFAFTESKNWQRSLAQKKRLKGFLKNFHELWSSIVKSTVMYWPYHNETAIFSNHDATTILIQSLGILQHWFNKKIWWQKKSLPCKRLKRWRKEITNTMHEVSLHCAPCLWFPSLPSTVVPPSFQSFCMANFSFVTILINWTSIERFVNFVKELMRASWFENATSSLCKDYRWP